MTERIYPELAQTQWEELLTRALAVVSESSGGTLTDFSIHSPVMALMEGAIWVSEDLTFRLNQLPVAVIRQWLEFWGASSTLGAPSSGTVTVYLGNPPMDTLTIPTGTVFYAGDIPFILSEDMVFSPFVNVATGRVLSSGVGSQNNLGVNAVNMIDGSSPLFGLVSAVQSTAMIGGLDPSDSDAAIVRTLGNLTSSRVITTKDDYHAAIRSLVPGSRSVIIPGMLSDGETINSPGNVHCFILMPGYRGPSPSESVALKTLIEGRNTIGTQVHISGIELMELYVRVNVTLDITGNPDTVYQDIREGISSYLNPYDFDDTAALYKELEYRARVDGVKRVGGAFMSVIGEQPNNDTATNIPLSHPRIMPKLTHLNVNILTASGIDLSYGDTFIPDEIPDTQQFDIEGELIDEFIG